MTASDIIDRALNLADLQNTDFITLKDKRQSLAESYKDIYRQFTDSNDDYFLQEVLIPILPSYYSANADNEMIIPLPADCYKIRYVDFFWGTDWSEVKRFPLSMKDYKVSQPHYRLQNGNLWIILAPGYNVNQFRVGYYPNPVTPSLPDTDIDYLTDLSDYQKTQITEAVYASQGKTLIRIRNTGTAYVIEAESEDLGTVTTLYSSANAKSSLAFYKGWLYWVESSKVYRAASNLDATVTPVQIVAAATKAWVANDFLYYLNAGTIYRSLLDGTSSTGTAIPATITSLTYAGALAYVDSNALIYNGAATLIDDAVSVGTDGTNLYYLDTSNNVYNANLGVLGYHVRSYVKTLAPYGKGRLACLMLDSEAIGMDGTQDTDFTYPLNEAWEIMSYQSAIDFKRKQSGATIDLENRLAKIWERFHAVLRKDENRPERIRQAYVTNRYGF